MAVPLLPKAFNFLPIEVTTAQTIEANAQNVIYLRSASPITVRLPDLAIVVNGFPFFIHNYDTGTVTLAYHGSGPTVVTLATGEMVMLIADKDDGNNIWRDILGPIGGAGTAPVTGPGLSTSNAVVLWNGTSGTSIKNSTVLIDEDGDITGVNTITMGRNLTLTGGALETSNIIFSTPANTTTTRIVYTPSGAIGQTYSWTLRSTTDTLVGQATTDTLTNKTLMNSNNSIGATALGVSGGAFVTVNSGAAPTTGQVLMATNGTAATWQNPPGTAITTPGSTTTNAMVRWANTVGSSIKNSGVITDDSNNMSGLNSLSTTIGGSTVFVAAPFHRVTRQDDLTRYAALQYIGTSAGGFNVQFRQPGSASDFVVYENTSQTLTNKIISGASNNVSCQGLMSNNNVTEINVSAAASPSVGQVLTATSTTTATWQNVTAVNFSGSLAGDVTGTQSATVIADGAVTNNKIAAGAGIVDSKLATITTGGKVANTATTATSANNPNTIVLRNGVGDFSAGIITATLNGSASSALTAGTANSATNFSGSLSGDVTGTQTATVIATGAVTNDKIATNAGIVDSKLATIATAGKVADSATSATPTNTDNTIVQRGVNGSFNAGIVGFTRVSVTVGSAVNGGIALLSGNANNFASATIGRTASELEFGVAASAAQFVGTSAIGDGVIRMNSGSNKLIFGLNNTAYGFIDTNGFNGNVVGNVTGTATNFSGSLSGNVTGTQGATVIANNVITNAMVNASAGIVDTKLATIATAGKVSNSATTATTAANNDTIMLRDAANGSTNLAYLITNVGLAPHHYFSNASSVVRWSWGLVNTESGANSGADIVLRSFNDAGSALASPLTFTRSTGNAIFSGTATAPTFIGNLTGTATISNALASTTTTVNVSSSTAPAAGNLLIATGSTAATWQSANNAGTSVNTINTLVARDGSGNFSAGLATLASGVAFGGGSTLSTYLTGSFTGNVQVGGSNPPVNVDYEFQIIGDTCTLYIPGQTDTVGGGEDTITLGDMDNAVLWDSSTFTVPILITDNSAIVQGYMRRNIGFPSFSIQKLDGGNFTSQAGTLETSVTFKKVGP